MLARGDASSLQAYFLDLRLALAGGSSTGSSSWLCSRTYSRKARRKTWLKVSSRLAAMRSACCLSDGSTRTTTSGFDVIPALYHVIQDMSSRIVWVYWTKFHGFSPQTVKTVRPRLKTPAVSACARPSSQRVTSDSGTPFLSADERTR